MDASSSSSSSNAPPVGKTWTYDVFLSFRGEDTRKNFVDHLYAALENAGIYTFKDDQKLQRGESISPELMKAIEGSMVTVVVFSENYADSCWCLEELAKIIECRDFMGQKVLPVFYDIDPSDVRGQKGSFNAAFERHEVKFIDNMDKVKSWREALVTTANLSGWDVPKTASGHEAECIKQIVRTILSYAGSYYPTENLIGMESRVQHVMSLLGKGSGDVCVVGICGMGGIGKTTIARAVYDQISYNFEGSSFLEEVRVNGSDKIGLRSLQEKLLSEILLVEHYNIKDCHDGILQIRRRLGRKKVLIVLDDVDNIKQLEFLAGSHEWFGPGSRIIVTTRDEHMLSYTRQKYAPDLLKHAEAMKLFSRYAFKANFPPKAYVELSHVVVGRTGYLPLALKVLGSHFCGRSLDFWQSSLKVMAKIPHKEINEILKLSFDGLNSVEKKIFLHIACFFKGRERPNVTRILDSFGFEPESGITVLIERSLLTISNGCLHMHDLVQEMGRCVVRECHPNNLLWDLDDIKEVMMTVNRLKMVEAIADTTHYHFSDTPMASCSAEAFKKMDKLSLLEVKGKFTLSEPIYFPKQLRWLSWYSYPFKCLRITRCLTKLVGLEMQSGYMEKLQIEQKVILPNLKFMNLSFSYSITSFPDISNIPNLEFLNLSFCSELVEVHQSVLLHKRIIHLYLSSCDSLKRIPSSIQMESLETLHLNGCSSLERFPVVSGEMEKLLVLNIDGCVMISKLPSSIRLLTGLIILTMGKYSGSVLAPFRNVPTNLHLLGPTHSISLRVLDLKHNHLIEANFPSDLGNVWPSLEKLDLSNNKFTRLPSSISQLSHLKCLNLSGCIHLWELPELPPLIQVLRADCTSSGKIGDLSNKYKWLFKIALIPCYEMMAHLLLMKSLVLRCAAVNHQLSITIPGRGIPNWFRNQQLGNQFTLNLPQNQITKMIGLAFCCHIYYMKVYGTDLKIKFRSSGDDKFKSSHEVNMIEQSTSHHVWMGYMPIDSLKNVCRYFDYENLVITFESDNDITKCAVCVVYKDDIKPMTGSESWIPDHMELGWAGHDDICREDLQHGRWSKPSLLCDSKKPGDDNTVYIHM